MRVLSRRGSGAATSGRMVTTPPRTVDRVLSPTLQPTTAEDSPRAERPSRAAQRAAAARRRRVLIVLVTVLVLTAALSAFALLPWWSAAVPAGIIVTFLIIARRQVRLAEEAFWAEASQQRPVPTNVVRRAAARVDASHGTAKSDPADDEPTVTLSTAAIAAAGVDLREDRVTAVALPTADGGSLWDPLPVTLPTYVDKPAAHRTIRTIDLGEPGTWSAGHNEDDSVTAATAKAAASAEAQPADESADETPRAVNS